MFTKLSKMKVYVFANTRSSDMADANSITSTDSLDDFPKKIKCEMCNQSFATHYSLCRHNKTFHADNASVSSDSKESEDVSAESSNDEDMSAESSNDEDMSAESSKDEDTSAESSNDESSSSEMEEEEDVPYTFRRLVCEVSEKHDDELTPIMEDYMSKDISGSQAFKLAFQDCNAAKKTLRRLFIQHIHEVRQLRRHSLYKEIMAKAKELMDEGFDEHEAIVSAVAYRKHALYNLVNIM